MDLFQKFASRFRRNQRVYVFFICVFISALFWSLLVLTKEYTSSIEIKASYSDFPKGLIQTRRLPAKFVLNIKASGYNLISLDEGNDLKVNVASLVTSGQGVQKISSRALIHDIVQQFGNDVSVLSIQPDTIVFDLSRAVSVKLPVKANLDVTFDKQYDSVSLHMEPDSVMTTIPASLAGSITRVETEPVQARSLRSPLKKKVKLLSPEGASLDKQETEVFLEVEKFTEGTAQVPVKLVNVPAGYTIKIYPDMVTVKYLVSLSHYSQVKPDMFNVIADAASAPSDPDEKLDLEVVSMPAGVRSVICQPLQVDFILKK